STHPESSDQTCRRDSTAYPRFVLPIRSRTTRPNQGGGVVRLLPGRPQPACARAVNAKAQSLHGELQRPEWLPIRTRESSRSREVNTRFLSLRSWRLCV